MSSTVQQKKARTAAVRVGQRTPRLRRVFVREREIVVSNGVFLKDLPADLVLKHLLPMLAAAAATFTMAWALFRARSE